MGINSSTATTIIVSWNISSDSVVDSYFVTWNASEECTNDDKGSVMISNSTASYTIEHLEEGSDYVITVRAGNVAGNVSSIPLTGSTKETRKKQENDKFECLGYFHFLQLHLVLPLTLLSLIQLTPV